MNAKGSANSPVQPKIIDNFSQSLFCGFMLRRCRPRPPSFRSSIFVSERRSSSTLAMSTIVVKGVHRCVASAGASVVPCALSRRVSTALREVASIRRHGLALLLLVPLSFFFLGSPELSLCFLHESQRVIGRLASLLSVLCRWIRLAPRIFALDELHPAALSLIRCIPWISLA